MIHFALKRLSKIADWRRRYLHILCVFAGMTFLTQNSAAFRLVRPEWLALDKFARTEKEPTP